MTIDCDIFAVSCPNNEVIGFGVGWFVLIPFLFFLFVIFSCLIAEYLTKDYFKQEDEE